MSELKLPHVEDLRTDATLIRGLQEDFKAIEQEDKDDDQALSDEVTDRKKGDGNLQGQINKLQERCQKLEDNSATHDEVEAAKSYMDHKAERVAWGSDGSTFTTMLTRALEDVQMQELIKNIIKG